MNSAPQRLVQEFVRIRQSREQDREAILLSLLSRSAKHCLCIMLWCWLDCSQSMKNLIKHIISCAFGTIAADWFLLLLPTSPCVTMCSDKRTVVVSSLPWAVRILLSFASLQVVTLLLRVGVAMHVGGGGGDADVVSLTFPPMLFPLPLVIRTFKTKAIVFFDTKVLAHRLNIVLGIAGIRAAELHGNLAMTQRLEALDR